MMTVPDVLIIDERTEWMKKEEALMRCFARCSYYPICSNRFGTQCRNQGGSKIPKLRHQRKVLGRMEKYNIQDLRQAYHNAKDGYYTNTISKLRKENEELREAYQDERFKGIVWRFLFILAMFWLFVIYLAGGGISR